MGANIEDMETGLWKDPSSCAPNVALADLTTGAYQVLSLIYGYAGPQHWVEWAPNEEYAVIAAIDEGVPIFYRLDLSPAKITEIKATAHGEGEEPLHVLFETASRSGGTDSLTVFAQSWTAAGEKPAKRVMIYLDLKSRSRRYVCPERTLTAVGKQFITRVEQNPEAANPQQPNAGFDWNQFGAAIAGRSYNQWGKVVLADPLAVDVEVSGITALPMGENVKSVEFTWRFKNLPEPLTPLVTKLLSGARVLGAAAGSAPGKGEAMMQLYDDGWRIQEVKGIRYEPGKDESFQLVE